MASTTSLEKLAAYVPMPVAQAVLQNPRPLSAPKSRRFPAAVLFADISGFTPLSEMLSQAGPTGAEELTHLINQYFTRMIRIAQNYHGQVVKFSGDAMTILFAAEDISLQLAARRAGECALIMQAQMNHFADINTSQGRVSFSMKVGIGAGEVLECSIGGVLGRWEYVVGGDPLVQVGMAERHAQPGQTILSPPAWTRAKKFFMGGDCPDSRGFVILEKVITSLPLTPPLKIDWRGLDPQFYEQAEKALQCYIPGAIKARLEGQAEWLAELRRITILFVGVGGFDYEHEEAGQRLQNFLQSVQEVIYRYEGSLGKVEIADKGTVLLILFGAPPFFHEDDSKRAVACALGLQTVARERHLRMAVGITEGSIFAGPVGAPDQREYTVIGDSVNLAARLMEYGRAGSIIISERVKEKAGAQFIVEDLGQVSLKGKSDSLPAYLVTGEQGVQDEILNRYLLHDDPLVGRKAELEQMRRLAARTRRGNRQVLLMEGELGLGKSRLAAEMVREWMMEGGVGYGSKCMSYGQQMSYQAWREILVAIFGLTPSLSAEQKLAHLTAGIAELPPPPGQPTYWSDRLPLLADVLSIAVPPNEFTRGLTSELNRHNTFILIEAIIQYQAARHPLLILLEDVQWADTLSLHLFAHIAQALAGAPLLLALIYRPAADMPALSDIRQMPDAYSMYLEPLSDQESLDLIRIVLGSRQLPSEVEAVVLQRGQGNPFFLQELTRAILDVIGNQQKQTADLLETLNLPDTVQDVIMARIDRLSEDEKLTLKIASVIGTNFQRLLLSEVHPMIDAHYHLPAQLERLESEKLLRLEQPAPKWEYVFRNVIAQEVVYEGLLLAQRRQLHAVVAEALENLAPDEVEQLAFHYKRAHNWDKALHYLKIAGQRALREYAHHAAIGYLSEILTCMIKRSEDEQASSILTPDYWDTMLERARLYNLIGWRDEELEDLGTLGIMAEALHDDYRRALVTRQWVYLYETSADYDSALEMIERVAQLAQNLGNDELLGQAYSHWGRLLYIQGQYQQAGDHLDRALQIAREQQDSHSQAECLNNQGLVLYYQANYDRARDAFEQAIQLWRELGYQVGVGQALSNLGQVFYRMGQYIEAEQSYHRALKLHRTIGDRVGEAAARHGLGKVERSLGNYPEAKRLFEEALTFYQTVGDRHREAYCMVDAGFLRQRQGDSEAALVYLEEAVALMRELNAPWWAFGEALTYYGWALLDAGRPEEARQRIIEAADIERDTHQEVEMVEDLTLLARIALTGDNVEEAAAYAGQVWQHLQQHGPQGIEYPAMVYLSLYQVFRANQQDDLAQAALEQGRQVVASLAAQLVDEGTRQEFLNNVPENWEIRALS